AGLDPEKPPATLTELASYARHITRFFPLDKSGKPSIMGFATGKANVWMFQCRVMQFGGLLVDEKGGKSHFNEAPAIKALAFIQDMLKEGIAVEAQGFDHQNDFKAQRVAMIENSIVSKVHMESGLKFEYGIAPLPGEATRAVILSGSNINIFDNGDPEKVKGAWEFIKWFTSTDIGAEWSVRTTYVPVRKSSLQAKILTDALAKDPNLRAPYDELEYIAFEPRLSCWFEVRDLMADILERATIEMGPPDSYMKEMSNNIDAILRHNAD
ncbi:MAG TPA: extracellular solute-binding protein, partial [Candidatus Ozemobacteraceae bacterium]|nr:extracellular solute-binding protein [Candidatus Ozemobacteraceae bacterium]